MLNDKKHNLDKLKINTLNMLKAKHISSRAKLNIVEMLTENRHAKHKHPRHAKPKKLGILKINILHMLK